MTYEQRNALYVAKRQELIANGQSYTDAHRNALLLLPDVAAEMHAPRRSTSIAANASTPRTVVINGQTHSIATAEERSQIISNAVADLQDRCKYDYQTAWQQIRRDSRFATVFANMADPSNPDHAKRNEAPGATRLAGLTPRIKFFQASLGITWDEAKKLALSQPEEDDMKMTLPPEMEPKSPVGNIR